MKGILPRKHNKQELRQTMRLTRPPRLEGVVKNKGTDKVLKPRTRRTPAQSAKKPQGLTPRQRKDYQLADKRR